ncbi:MAG: type II toxin-antitoxin system VapC family toxin [Lachnospiraceae bacterium]|nr:type II toxin-antitoxin system VapC family toxin [Lachnospiraceae bacterium]
MKRYLLDTNMVIYAIKNNPAMVLEKIQQFDYDDINISAITLAELEYGVCHSSKPEQNNMALMMFLSNVNVLPFDDNAALEYGPIRETLQEAGLIIGSNDMLIAAHAKSLNYVLVTHNTREFERVPGIEIEDWAL